VDELIIVLKIVSEILQQAPGSISPEMIKGWQGQVGSHE